MPPGDVTSRCIFSLLNLFLFYFPYQEKIMKNTVKSALEAFSDEAIKKLHANSPFRDPRKSVNVSYFSGIFWAFSEYSSTFPQYFPGIFRWTITAWATPLSFTQLLLSPRLGNVARSAALRCRVGQHTSKFSNWKNEEIVENRQRSGAEGFFINPAPASVYMTQIKTWPL